MLCDHLSKAAVDKKPCNLSLLFRCLTSEIIMEYAMAQQWGFLTDLKKAEAFFASQNSLFKSLYVFREFQIAFTLMNLMLLLPASWIKDPLVSFSKELQDRLKLLRSGDDSSVRTVSSKHRVLLEELPHSNLPAEDRTADAMLRAGELILSAGFETTAYALEHCFFNLASNKAMYKRLRNEVQEAFPNEQEMAWIKLEKLPFLSAVIDESLRMSLGVMSRLVRLNNTEDMVYTDQRNGKQGKSWRIPKGYGVGMSQRFIHYDPEIFEEPMEFNPDRWLQGEKSEHLKKFLVPFSKGARVCLGKELAMAELYLTIATVVRRFEFQLFETTREDIVPTRDFFIPKPETDNEVRVIVEARD